MRRAPFLSSFFAVALGATTLIGCPHTAEYRDFPAGEAGRTLELGGRKVEIEVAATGEQRRHGLMFRRSMPEDHGMLFVYPRPQVLDFWMQNTYLPLSIAFIDDKGDGKGEIVNIEDMQPLVETPGTVSRRAVRLALEMNQGWFAKHGVKNGDVVNLPAWLKDVDAKPD